MAGAPRILVIAFLFSVAPASAQEREKSSAKPSSENTSNADSLFDAGDDPVSGGKSDNKPLDELGKTQKASPGNAAASGVGGAIAGAATGLTDAAKSAADLKSPELKTAAVSNPGPDPDAAPIKREIQAAIERNDDGAVRRLMGQALKRFPNDPELKDAAGPVLSRLPEGKARAMAEFAQAEAAKLFGQQWMPGRNADEEIGVALEKGPRGGSQLFGRGAQAEAAAVKQGYSYLDKGDPRKAEQVLTQSLRRQPNSAALHYARVIARGLNGDMKGADDDSLRAVALSQQLSASLSQRASLMMQMGRREEAYAWADRALQGNPRDADAYAVRGRCLWKDRDRPDAALEDLRRAAQLDPDQYATLYREGQRRYYAQQAAVSVGRGDYRQAFINSGLVLNADPGNVQAHLVRSLIYWKMGKPEETIKDATLALKSDPRSTWALFHRSLAMEALGRRDFAIADMRRAVAINPAKFGPLLNKLVEAQRAGVREPVWPRESVAAAGAVQ